MSHCVVKVKTGGYMGPRKATKEMYVSRTSKKGTDLDRARVFNNVSAAKNAMRSAGVEGQVFNIGIRVKGYVE